jgi:predicted  nucleic acid-binding Zn-ribbon protein
LTEIESLVLPILKAMQTDIAAIKRDVSDIKMRLAAIETHMAALNLSDTRQSARLDELDARIQRLERQANLVPG